MKDICTEVEIKASAELVWRILTDFEAYPQWNPFIRWIRGQPKVDTRLKIRVEPSGAKGYTFRPKVLKVEPNRELRWRGGLLIPGLFQGEHSFTLEPLTAGRVRLVHREVFTGLLVPRLSYTLDKDIRRGFQEMNKALKKRAEKGVT